MSLSTKTLASVALIANLAVPAFAQASADSIVLPPAIYDDFAVIGYVNSAKQQCPGAKVNERNFNKMMTATLVEVNKLGIDPVEAVNSLSTEAGQAQMKQREAAFRARHGVDANSVEALCTAIAQESKDDKSFRKMVKFKK